MAGSLTLRVITPERIVLDEVVDTVVVPATDGLTGILPKHARMVVALDAGDLKYRGGGAEQHLFVAGGFAEVANDTVRVITEASERPTDIDVERAQQAAERARERLHERQRGGDEPIDVLRAEASLRRAMVRLRLSKRS